MSRRLTLPDSYAPIGDDARRHAPSAARNADAILAVVACYAPQQGRALELASGTGQHIAALAAAHPALDWHPSDLNPDNLASICAWAAAHPAPNLRTPMVLNAAIPGWAALNNGWSLILTVNLLHLISAREASTVITEAARALAPGGRLALYGPFLRDGQPTSPGDAAFDASLRAQDVAIGYKDLAWVQTQLAQTGLQLRATEQMPANNLMLIAERPA